MRNSGVKVEASVSSCLRLLLLGLKVETARLGVFVERELEKIVVGAFANNGDGDEGRTTKVGQVLSSIPAQTILNKRKNNPTQTNTLVLALVLPQMPVFPRLESNTSRPPTPPIPYLLSNPNKHLASAVHNERVVGVERVSVQLALLQLRKGHLAGSVAQLEP